MVAMLPLRAVLLSCAIAMLPTVTPAQVPVPVPPQVAYTGTPVPLLSIDSLHFLEGTWSATTRDGQTQLGSYSFVRELNGHVLQRVSKVAPGCDPVAQPLCARQDVFYVYQDSPGAPLKAISFDNEGHVLHYLTEINTEEAVSRQNRRNLVVFTSDPAQLGQRVRLRYDHNVDTQTGKESMSGAFDLLQANGQWLAVQQWWGCAAVSRASLTVREAPFALRRRFWR